MCFIVYITCDVFILNAANERNHYNADFGIFLQLIFTTLMNFRNFKDVDWGSTSPKPKKALQKWTCPPPFNFCFCYKTKYLIEIYYIIAVALAVHFRPSKKYKFYENSGTIQIPFFFEPAREFHQTPSANIIIRFNDTQHSAISKPANIITINWIVIATVLLLQEMKITLLGIILLQFNLGIILVH